MDTNNADFKDLLSSPQSYLSTLPADEAQRIRSMLVPAYRQGFRVIFLVGASLAAFAFVIAWFMMPQVELRRPDDEKLKEEGRKEHAAKKNAPAP